MSATVEDIPFTPAPEDIKPGRRVRVNSRIRPLVLANLTGTIEDKPSSKPDFTWVMLDESSTQALRQDHRAGSRRPSDTTTRVRLHIPTACLMSAENDS
ncbi:hypothetical protein [Streptomyces cinereoruber]